MSSNSLENEDMDNVPLVRMEDVQPSRERTLDSLSSPKDHTEVYETYIIDSIDYENECIVNDDEDSNIGSMVSLRSENVFEDESSSEELIIPECLEEVDTENDEEELEIYIDSEKQCNFTEEYLEDPIDDGGGICKGDTLDCTNLKTTNKKYLKMAIEHDLDEEHLVEMESKIKANELVTITDAKPSKLESIEIEVPPSKRVKVATSVLSPSLESWPTLEILPGGVIKNTEKYGSENILSPEKVPETVVNPGEMMYACAKCSQTFKYLFCLVKHVKWHEDQKRITKTSKDSEISETETELLNLKRERMELDKLYKKQKLVVINRIAVAIGKINTIKNIFNK